jgi:hypothetical protein
MLFKNKLNYQIPRVNKNLKKAGENMNPDIRAYMYQHYGTGYMPYPYGTHIGYGYSIPLSLYHHYHPHHMVHHPGGTSGSTFAVPLQASVRW